MAASLANMIRGGCSVVLQQRHTVQSVVVGPMLNVTPVCCSSTKHYNPKFKRLRKEKVLFVKRESESNFQTRMKKLTPDQRRIEQKKMGMPFGNQVKTRELSIASTETVFDPYIPREGKGKTSIISSFKEGEKVRERAVEKTKFVTKMRAKRKIASYEQDFTYESIAPQLQNIYIESQRLLTDLKKNSETLFDYVTPFAYNKMTYKLDKSTLRWEFVESLEPPKVVHASVQEMALSENYYAQLTLRVHLRQKFALYDRFGRLMYGDPDLVKNVLEYIVFENRIISFHSRWRVHDKIIPKWHDDEEFVYKTYKEDPIIDLDKKDDKAEK